MNSVSGLEKTYRTNKIIASVLAAAMLVYVAVVEVFRFQGLTVNPLESAILETLRFAFVFLAFAAYFVIKYLNKKILVKKPGDTQEKLLQKLTLANLVSLTLAEFPALFGFVLFLISGNPRDFYPLLVISALLFYAFFPKYALWSAWSRAPGLS